MQQVADPNVTGLDDEAVARRRAAGQTNAFTPDPSRSAWHIVRANVFTRFNAIVFACFFVLFLVGRWQDALFGFAAFGNAIIGCVQEFRAKAALDRLALLNAPRAIVRRNGMEVELAPAEVVLDDLLVLRAGEQVAADAEVISGRGLQIDESMLTGESDPVDKTPGTDALSGSIVVGGAGLARVTRVGADSYANRFAGEARRFSLVASELRTSINRLLTWVGWGIGPIGLLVFNAQVQVAGGYATVFTTDAWVQAVVNTIASLTAMIPLGLVLMTSIAFAVGAVKLSRRQVLVNELPAVEGLARVDVVCLDKTGTLTVGEIAFDEARALAPAPGWEDALAWYAASPDANATARAMRERFVAAPEEAGGYIPFSSARKWSAVTLSSGTWVLGAPEMIFGDTGMAGTAFGATVTELADTGRRTLVLARTEQALSDADIDAERLPAGLVPVTVLTFREQVRPDAAQTLEYFRLQDVGVRIISGDNPRTVAAIAREVGLDVPDGYDARQLPEDDAALAEVLEHTRVFGRVTPEQKERMVRALQSSGHTVAMTGDGVNDALAIKAADIGIAMNSGSAATKAVARLVLLDGRFSHLPDVVAEGRQAIANIERVSMLFLTKTVYATALAILFGALVLEFPFLPRQLSITDGLTIGIPAFFLALLPNTQRYIPGFLRRSLSFAIPAGIIIALGLTWYDFVAKGAGATEEQLRTGATVILAVVGIWVLSVLARPLNRFKVLVVGAMFVGLVGVFTIPLATQFFALVDPGPVVAAALTGISLVMIAGIEVVRIVHRRVMAPLLAATPAPTRSPLSHAAGRVLAAIVSVLIYANGVLLTAVGVLVLLDRYNADTERDVLFSSLLGAGIALAGLLVLTIATGLHRGSGLSRLAATVFLVGAAILNAILAIGADDFDVAAVISLVISAALVVVLWTPPASRTFRRIGESTLTQSQAR